MFQDVFEYVKYLLVIMYLHKLSKSSLLLSFSHWCGYTYGKVTLSIGLK